MSDGRAAMEDENEDTDGEMEKQEEPEFILDALPYIDADGDRNEVDRLIAAEMKNKKEKQPDDYLAEISARAPQFSLLDSAFVKDELERVEQGKPQTPMDNSRYTITPPPKSKRNSRIICSSVSIVVSFTFQKKPSLWGAAYSTTPF